MHASRPVVISGFGFAAIALALPFVTFPVIGAVGGLSADAWPALLPLAPAVATALLGDWARGSRPAIGAVSLLFACGGLVFSVVKLADAILAARHVAGASVGAGAPVLVAGTATVVIGAVLALRSS